jgi:vanillate O-demethylase monooxygenase subunit
MGKVRGDCLQCPYHGLEFNREGACTRNPHGDGAIPKVAKVRAYPVIERFSAIWIWMGDPLRADASVIPDFSTNDSERRFVGTDYLLAKASARWARSSSGT